MTKIKLIILLLMVAIITPAWSGVPSAFKFQALITGNNGEILSDTHVTFRISILESSEDGTVVFSETHDTTTNSYGLISIVIGQGTPVTSTINDVDWSLGIYFFKIEFDPSGGTAYQLMSTSQLLSVPYALYADATNQSIDDADNDHANELITNIATVEDTLKINEGGYLSVLDLTGAKDGYSHDDQTMGEVLTQGNSSGLFRIINIGNPLMANDVANKASVDTLYGLMLRVFDASWLLDSGILTAQQLYNQGRSTKELVNAGIDLDTLVSFGATIRQFIEDGVQAVDLFADTIILNGNTGIFTDPRDDSTYSWVAIEDQIWMSQNLDHVPDTGHYYRYLNIQANADTFGYLYTWYTAQAMCPAYWHLPSDGEWNVLEFNLGMAPADTAISDWRGTDQGTQLKEGGTSGFNAKLGGTRAPDGVYMNKGFYGYYWTSTGTDTNAWIHYVWSGEARVARSNPLKTISISVRCIKD